MNKFERLKFWKRKSGEKGADAIPKNPNADLDTMNTGELANEQLRLGGWLLEAGRTLADPNLNAAEQEALPGLKKMIEAKRERHRQAGIRLNQLRQGIK